MIAASNSGASDQKRKQELGVFKAEGARISQQDLWGSKIDIYQPGQKISASANSTADTQKANRPTDAPGKQRAEGEKVVTLKVAESLKGKKSKEQLESAKADFMARFIELERQKMAETKNPSS